jgi:isochorismate synthase EntC
MSVDISQDLSLLNLDKFLASGFIFQCPLNRHVWLGAHLLVTDDESYTHFHTNFYQTKTNYYSVDGLMFKVSLDELLVFLKLNTPNKLIISEVENTDSDYLNDVVDSLKWIKGESKIQKLVGVTRANYTMLNSEHPVSNLPEMAKLHGSLYGIWNKGSGVLGNSPEPLYVKALKGWKTTALAGTISTNKSDYRELLLSNQKEIFEHKVVLDGIVDKLKSIDLEVSNEDTKVFDFGPIAHLKADISFYTKANESISSKKIVELLSPTAALGGYPVDSSLDYLRKLKYFSLEKEQRSFGGIYGFRFDATEFGLVGIRNIYWELDEVYIHSGSGIVDGSDPELECIEVRKKRASIAGSFLNA